MRKKLMLLTGVLIISCNQKTEQKTDVDAITLTENAENFDWLLGKWKRINEVEGVETFENWQKTSATDYVGIGFTMKNKDTIWQEKMQLHNLDGKWNLVVKVPEEAETITFYGVSHNENEFSCENNENDFPNLIKYQKNGEKIHAVISGGDLEISYDFERLKE